jgi:hypothetical protein
MQPNFLGKISAPTAGAPVQIIADRAIRACKILIVTIPGLAGSIYVGGQSLDMATLAGTLMKFNPPCAVGLPDHFSIVSANGSNSLVVADYWLAASVAGEGALVTYFQA